MQMTVSDHILSMINVLRSDEGSSVTILCDNPDYNGQPDRAIVCNGAWTDWQDRRFANDSLINCFEGACRAFHAMKALPTDDTGDNQIKQMTERFLRWKLPTDFSPDAGISFKPTYNDTPEVMAMLDLDEPMRHEPTGTNLLDYTQAEAMVRFLLGGDE